MRPQLRWSTRVHKVRFSVELLNAGEIEPGLVAHHWLARASPKRGNGLSIVQ